MSLYKFVFYVNVDHATQVKNACFQAGGGRIGNYDCCAFEVEGTGQFRPLENAKPFIGQHDEVEKVKEVRVEMVVEKELVKEVYRAMKETHPYEEPAFSFTEIVDPLKI